MNARQQSILQVVIDKGRMSVADLAKMTGVSEVTIRQDLNLLEKHCEAIILSDSSKFSAVHPYPLGPAGRFNRVITDDRLPNDCREQLLRSGLTVDIVPYV